MATGNPKASIEQKAVPIQIHALYEVVRGAIIYGYLFYPLYTLGIEQLFRVAEAAVKEKCKEIGAPKSIRTFEKRIDYLVNENVIPQEVKPTWDAVRKLRNFASHPEGQNLHPPGMVVGLLERTVNSINSLFLS